MGKEDDELRALVDKARLQDREAFGRIYDMYYERIYRFAYYKVCNISDAEDIAAQTFTGALRTIANFKWTGSSFDSWLFRIAHNVTVDTYRRNGRAKFEPVDDHLTIAAASDTSAEAIGRAEHARVRKLIDRLPEEQRRVLILKFIVGMSNKEVGAAIDKTAGAIKALQFRGLNALRATLREEGDFSG